MPVENFEDNAPAGLSAALQKDRARKGRLEDQPYATKEFIYWMNADGMICFGQRTSSNAVTQFIRRTGESIMHPDLRDAGWCLVDEACDTPEEIAAIRKHMDAHTSMKQRGRKARVVFSPPLEDMPSEALRRQIASGFLGQGARKADAEKILAARKAKSKKPVKGKAGEA